ncbi:MAG: hypothetical protein B6D55_04050 [Candidatus Omnitrophica bacterium 4484_70.2]|nr:MAG: hypothetical protein B6D55_04050 [Candidatus Omnitrophica bacterium 4484_70.2]
MEIITQFNWINLISLLFLVRICYIAQKRGFLCEFVKLLGVFVASFFSFQYYSLFLSRFTTPPFSFNRENVELVSFLIIFFIISIFFFFIRVLFSFFESQVHSPVEKGIALLMGILRASLLISVFLFLLGLSSFKSDYLYKSFSYKIWGQVAPKTYLLFFKVYKEVNPAAKVNEEVKEYYEVKETLRRNSEKGDRS